MEKKITISFTQKQMRVFTSKDGAEFISVILPYNSKYQGFSFILPVEVVFKDENKDSLYYAELEDDKNIKISKAHNEGGEWKKESIWLKASRLKKELDSWKKCCCKKPKESKE
ncbi:hypothetical protein [Holdemania massiliensis]|uniref:hypothetical protein n=1 Tax=Holdemania massiliensis TaxID=1468449 RepID=UPI001F05614C|nr:hypothetical protein [Holdemania massiliensis]MCH1942432.1 hypothetical protein [Holdemania massiliensis]